MILAIMLFALMFNVNIDAKTKDNTIVEVNDTITIDVDTEYTDTTFVMSSGLKVTNKIFNIKSGATLTLKNSVIESANDALDRLSDLITVEGKLVIENVVIKNTTFSGVAPHVIDIKGAGQVNIDGLEAYNLISIKDGVFRDAALIGRKFTDSEINDKVTLKNINFHDNKFGRLTNAIKNLTLLDSTIKDNTLNTISDAIYGFSGFVMENTVFENNIIRADKGFKFREDLSEFNVDNLIFKDNQININNSGGPLGLFFQFDKEVIIPEINFNKLIFDNNAIIKKVANDRNEYAGTIIYGELKNNTKFNLTNSAFNNNEHNDTLIYLIGNKDVDFIFENNTFNNNVNIHSGSQPYVYGNMLALSKIKFEMNNNEFNNNVDKNGKVNRGGAMLLMDTEAIIKNSVFTSNKAIYGGAIYAQNSEVIDISNSDFKDNVSTSVSGAIYLTNSNANLNNTNFINNQTFYYGGAVTAINSSGINTDIKVNNSLFKANKVTNSYNYEEDDNDRFASGGALLIGLGTNTVINNVDFIQNQTNGWGGAIGVFDSAALEISKAKFDKNHAGIYGGGIYNNINTPIHLDNVFMDGNSSQKWGGSLFVCPTGSMKVKLNNSLAVFNDTAVLGGDSLYSRDSDVKIAQYSLGLGKTYVYEDAEGMRYKEGDKPLGYEFMNKGTDKNEYLKFEMSNYQTAKDRADIVFTNNTAGIGGGATGSNGEITFGDDGSVSVEVEKQWDDNDNEKGHRPDSIEVALKGDGVLMDVATLDKDNNYYYKFSELPIKSINDKNINYTIEELNVDKDKYEVTYHDREEYMDDNGDIKGYKFIIENKYKEIPPVEPGKPGPEKPNPVNPTNPLPETGSNSLAVVSLLMLLGLLGSIGLQYREN